MKTIRRWIVVRATNGDVRLVKVSPALSVTKNRKLKWDEIAFMVEVQVPDLWKKVQDDVLRIVLPVPNLPTAFVEASKETTP